MPEELAGAGPAPSVPATPTATPTPAPSGSPATSPSGTFSGGPGLPTPPSPSGPSASPGTPAGAVTPPPATPWSLRSAAAKVFPGADQRFQTDEAIGAELIRAAAHYQQVSPYAALGQKYGPRQAEIDAWLAEQDKVKAAQAAAAKPNWWQAPDYDPAWLQGVLRDHNGALVAKPGYPPDLPAKIEAYQNFQVEKINAFMKDPVALLKGGLEPLIQEIAGKIVGERQAASQQEQFATGYVAQNAAWLMEKDAAGNPAYDVQGKPILTAAGQRFRQHVSDLVRAGVADPRMQQKMAEERLELDILRMKQNPQNPAGTPPPAAPAAQPPAFGGLGAGHQPPYGAAVTPPAAQSLDQMLREAAQAAGLMSSTPAASL